MFLCVDLSLEYHFNALGAMLQNSVSFEYIVTRLA